MKKGFAEVGRGVQKTRATRGGRGGRGSARGRGGRPRGRGRGGKGRSLGRRIQAPASPPQRARRSAANPSNAVAGPSNSRAQDEQEIAPSKGARLPSPPPSERRATSSNTLLNVPPLPRAPSGSLPAATQQRADPLRASIRHIAESISSFDDENACADEQLRWLIGDLKRRVVSSQDMLSAVVAEDEAVHQAVFETIVNKGRDIVEYAEQNSASIARTDFDLYMLILDLGARLGKR